MQSNLNSGLRVWMIVVFVVALNLDAARATDDTTMDWALSEAGITDGAKWWKGDETVQFSAYGKASPTATKNVVSAMRVSPISYWGFATNMIFRPHVAAKTKVQWVYDPIALDKGPRGKNIRFKNVLEPTSTWALVNRDAYNDATSADAVGIQLATWTIELPGRNNKAAKLTPEERQELLEIVRKFINSAIQHDYFLVSDTKLADIESTGKVITEDLR